MEPPGTSTHTTGVTETTRVAITVPGLSRYLLETLLERN